MPVRIKTKFINIKTSVGDCRRFFIKKILQKNKKFVKIALRFGRVVGSI